MTVDRNETSTQQTPCDRPELAVGAGCYGCLGSCEPRRDDWSAPGA